MRPEDVKRVFQNNADDLVEWISKGTTSFSVQMSLERLVYHHCLLPWLMCSLVRLTRSVGLKSVAQPFFIFRRKLM